MNKKLLAVIIILFCFLCLYADSSPKTYFPSLRSGTVLPVDKVMGQTVSSSSSSAHLLLQEALTQSYELSWCESYLAEETKAALTSLYSSLFAEILPSKSHAFSSSFVNGDGSVSISVRFEDGKIVTFAIKDNRILAVTY